MEIPNLNNQPPINATAPGSKNFSSLVLAAVIPLAIVVGFLLSRILPLNNSTAPTLLFGDTPIPIESIKSSQDLVVGSTYGNAQRTFKDTATGTIEVGSLNGEGTHILNREGGVTQRAALTSSVLDLDLFIGRRVEVKGETNVSDKTAWLMDVGSIKLLE